MITNHKGMVTTRRCEEWLEALQGEARA